MHSTTSQMSTRDRIGAILRVTSGNFLEQFDFFLFGFYATYIAHTFFPASSEFASLMMTFAVFGAGFLMRPIGAIVLGAYIDKVGRRKGLIVTLSIMATGTFLIVLIPSYQTIGLWAPLLVLIGRLLQGFSAGAELGGVSVYLAEIATPGRKGFYTSWQSGSQQVAIMVAAAMGFALNAVLEPSAISDWGWRIPFLFGCLIVPFIFILRRKLEETQEFTARRHHLAMRQVFATLLANWQVVIAGMMMVAMTTTAFYLITVYAPTFGANRLKLADYGRENEVEELNARLVDISKKALAGTGALIAGDFSTPGKMLQPKGDLSYEELLESYTEQVTAVANAGVDLLVAETMLSVDETCVFMDAALSVCDLPIMCSLTLEADGSALFGGNAVEAVETLQEMGASAVGLYCSVGPDQLEAVVNSMKKVARVPVIVKPNAGLPKITPTGEAIYSMDAPTFAKYMNILVDAGAGIVGGCCGTTPEYIRLVKEMLDARK